MKFFLFLLGLVALIIAPLHAKCKDCGCKVKCSTSCQCKHDEKPKG